MYAPQWGDAVPAGLFKDGGGRVQNSRIILTDVFEALER
jgi:hypothetical protein